MFRSTLDCTHFWKIVVNQSDRALYQASQSESATEAHLGHPSATLRASAERIVLDTDGWYSGRIRIKIFKLPKFNFKDPALCYNLMANPDVINWGTRVKRQNSHPLNPLSIKHILFTMETINITIKILQINSKLNYDLSWYTAHWHCFKRSIGRSIYTCINAL